MGLLSKRFRALSVTFAILFITMASSVSACIIITEVYPRPAVAKNEWVEIYNNCSATVNLSLLAIADDDAHTHRLNGALSSGDFCVVANNASMFNESFSTAGPLVDLGGVHYWLNNDGDTLILLNGSDEIDLMEYGDVRKNVSVSRCGGGWEVTGNATPGRANDCPREEPGGLSIEGFGIEPAEVVGGDSVTFILTVSNSMEEPADFLLNVSVEGIEEVRCGLFLAENGSEETVECIWAVPEDVGTEGPEEFAAVPVIVFNGTEIRGPGGTITIEGLPDLGAISLSVAGPREPVRFGDFAHVEAAIYTGNVRVPMRIVTYVYKPRWITTDLDGNTIRSHLNETKVSLLVEDMERGQKITLLLPIFLRSNCDGEYEEGVYTGRVRIYKDKTSDVITEQNFNITMKGENGLFCSHCPPCEENGNDCDCPSVTVGGVSGSTTSPETSMFMEILGFNETVAAGGSMETRVKIENVLSSSEEFSLYSYAFNGSRCISLGLEGDSWKKTWTANKRIINLEPGSSQEVVLKNMIEKGTRPALYKFRVRIKYGDEKEDITLDVNVTEASEGLSYPEDEDAGNYTDAETVQEGNETSEDSEGHERANETGPSVTGTVVSESGDIFSFLSSLYDSFTSWLLSIFKF